jgi:CheY-like chemotaxis protein
MAQPSLIGQGWWSIATRPCHHSNFALPPMPRRRSPRRLKSTEGSPPHHRRALIVEDETMIALSLETDMQGLGFDTCDLAADGQQASRLAMSNQPDVVLMDVNLEGGREGIEAARWLRRVCDVPIVFVTGYTDRATVERIHEQVPGAPVLSKAFYRARIADAVSVVTQHQR